MIELEVSNIFQNTLYEEWVMGEGGKKGIVTRQGRGRKELKGWPILIITYLRNVSNKLQNILFLQTTFELGVGFPYPLTHSTPLDLSVRFVKIYIIYCLPVYLMPILLLSNFAGRYLNSVLAVNHFSCLTFCPVCLYTSRYNWVYYMEIRFRDLKFSKPYGV